MLPAFLPFALHPYPGGFWLSFCPGSPCKEGPALPEWFFWVFVRAKARVVMLRCSLQGMQAWGRSPHVEWVSGKHVFRKSTLRAFVRLCPTKLLQYLFQSHRESQNISLKIAWKWATLEECAQGNSWSPWVLFLSREGDLGQILKTEVR